MEVYRITNKINNKCYIGITKRNFRMRYNHRDDWWNAPSVNILLKNSVNKYSPENFTVEILEKTENFDDLLFLEKYYIKFFNSLAPNGFNLTTGGDSKFELTDKTKQKISESKKGRPGIGKNIKGHKKNKETIEKFIETKRKQFISGELKPWNKGKKTGRQSELTILKSAIAHKKAVLCFDKNNNLIKEYEGIIDTEKDGFKSSQVSLCCKHPMRYHSHRTYIWKYKENKD